MNHAKVLLAVAAAAGTSLVLAASALAAPGPQVDQSVTDTSNSFVVEVSEIHHWVAAQTFTAGVSGELSGVRVWVWRFIGAAGQIDVELHPVDAGGDPDTGIVLAAAQIPVSSLDNGPTIVPVEATFSTPAMLAAGTKYAITLAQSNGGHVHIVWQGPGNDNYPGGTGYGGSFASYSSVGEDLAFETLMVVPAPPIATAPSGRHGYCLNGRFMDLIDGQPGTDPTYAGATSAIYVKGRGITCDTAPAGYVLKGKTTSDQDVSAGAYDFWSS